MREGRRGEGTRPCKVATAWTRRTRRSASDAAAAAAAALHHQGQRDSDAVAGVASIAVAVCCKDGVVDSGDDGRGGEGLLR